MARDGSAEFAREGVGLTRSGTPRDVHEPRRDRSKLRALARYGETGIRRGDVRRLTLSLVATIVLGGAFLATQVVEYARLEHMPQTNAYWSVFYTITGIHGAHVLLGLLMLAMNLVRATRGHFTSERHLAVQNGALYWHTVDLVWIAIVIALYISPRL